MFVYYRLADSVETALKSSNGVLSVLRRVNKTDESYREVTEALDAKGTPYDRDSDFIEQEVFFSQKNACPDCGISIPELAMHVKLRFIKTLNVNDENSHDYKLFEELINS